MATQPKYYSIKYTDREESIEGLVLDVNDDWTLLLYNPIDYVVDGYAIIRHVAIEGSRRDEDDMFVEKVLQLKGADKLPKPSVRIDLLMHILQDVTTHSKLCMLQLEDEEDASYVGIFKSMNGAEVTLDSVSPKGELDGEMSFDVDEIRIIYFDTDYLKSLALVLAQ